MDKVYVHERVSKRHPDVSVQDVLTAWENCIRSRPRILKNPRECLAVGIDGRGRLIEMVAIADKEGDWLIYHAMTPLSENAKKELGFGRGMR